MSNWWAQASIIANSDWGHGACRASFRSRLVAKCLPTRSLRAEYARLGNWSDSGVAGGKPDLWTACAVSNAGLKRSARILWFVPLRNIA